MKYLLNNPYLPYAADRIITGGYGENDFSCGACCSVCGEDIRGGEEYYDVNGRLFCMLCEGAAQEHILDEVRDSYIHEL